MKRFAEQPAERKLPLSLSAEPPRAELLSATLLAKRERLCGYLSSLDSVIVAYSGGVDSAFLAWMAGRVMGNRMLAVLADSPSLADSQRAHAIEFATRYNIPFEIIRTTEFDDPQYTANAKDRCFHCKSELFATLSVLARKRSFAAIAYGANVDDLADYRPGNAAAAEYGALAPLVKAELGKEEIRQLARAEGLAVWDRPAAPCLSSRIAYGIPVTIQTVRTIDQGEDAVRALGFREFRVRHHGDLVRIEVSPAEMDRALDPLMAKKLTAIFRRLGYAYVTLDLEGFRSGSMNEVL